MSGIFDYGVDFDAKDALDKTKKLEGGLIGIEDRAKKSGHAIEDSFNKGAAAAKNAHGQIEASGVAIADYEAALVRLNAPYDKLEKDMRVLNALQQTGVITAKQYGDELARIGKEHGLTGTQHGLGAVSLEMPTDNGIGGKIAEASGEATGTIKDHLLGLVAPAGLALGALQAIGEEFNNWKQRAADVREATNSILKFHASIDLAKAAMDEQNQLSQDLGLNITKTTHAYAAVREATEDFGVSSKEAADITRNMTAAVIVDGGAIENVTGIMDKLQYSSEAGLMTQRELKSIWRESPEVVHMFEKALGKTYPELMKMAAEGKLAGKNLETMVHGTAQGTEAIDKYRQRLLTVDQVMEENHVDMFKAVLIMADMKKKYEELSDTGPQAFERGAAAGEHQVVVLTQLAEKLQLIMTTAAVQGNFATDKARIDEGLKVQAMLDAQGNRYQQFSLKVKDLRREMTALGYDAKAVDGIISQLHGPDWVDYYLQQLDQVRQPERDWNGRLRALQKLLHDKTITLDQYADSFAKAYAQSPAAISYTKELTAATARYKAEIEGVIQAQKTGVVSPSAVGLHGRFAVEAEHDAKMDADRLGGGQAAFSKQADDAEREAQALVDKYSRTTTAAEHYRDALIDIELHGAALDDETRARLLANAEVKKWEEGGAAARKAAEQFKKADEVGSAAESSLRSGVSDLVGEFANAADGADVSWSKFFRNMAKNIATAILQAAALKAIGSTGVGGGTPSGLLGTLGALFGGAHATGGMYQAPATGGGADTVPVMFRMSPKERAYFVPEGQSLPQQVAPMQMNARTVIVNKHADRADDVVDAFDNTRSGDQVIYNFMQRNRRAVSGIRRR